MVVSRLCVDVCRTVSSLQGANILLNDQGEVKLGRWMFALSALLCTSVVRMSHSLQKQRLIRHMSVVSFVQYVKTEWASATSDTGLFGGDLDPTPFCCTVLFQIP